MKFRFICRGLIAASVTAAIAFSSAAMAKTPTLWVDQSCIDAAPVSGEAWARLLVWANQPITSPDLSDQDDLDNVRTLAAALVFARTGQTKYRDRVRDSIERVRGTERHARALAVGRELVAYVIAADLIGLSGSEKSDFEAWLRRTSRQAFAGMSLKKAHERRPNNWGTHAGASRIAVAAYLRDDAAVAAAAHVFKGWLGERNGWRRFNFRQRWWQSQWFSNYAINPAGAERDGHSLDGVLPEEMRRAGRFRWPPPKENYAYEALQGALTQAMLLSNYEYPVWSWGDRALLRAYEWLHHEADFPAVGDDVWQIPVINAVYGTHFPVSPDGQPGKGIGFTDWLASGAKQLCFPLPSTE